MEQPPTTADGAFARVQSTFREVLEVGASGRYHLYVAAACPWSHRAMLVRVLRGLQDDISISYCDPIRDERGWAFTGGAYVDQLNHFDFLAQAYELSAPGFSAHVSVPVLWDKADGRIVNNESSEIIRGFNNAFAGNGVDLYPLALRPRIDELNERIYETLNNGVYRAGFATGQVAYEQAGKDVFATLDWLEELLAHERYLTGEQPTEADWRLFPTLVRFDTVYYGHFKCNLARLSDFPNLWGYTRDLYQLPGVAQTVRFDEFKRHYYGTHPSINPFRIVPIGPRLDFEAPHGRG